MATAVSGRWTRVRTLGRGASGAVVSLAADEATGALFAVKWASAAAAAAGEQLRREGSILSSLRSPHVLPCLGFRAEAGGGECQLFLEYAPGGTLADAAARSGGRLDERAVGAYAADVARGLAYLHGRSLVHGDVKARNVVVGADGRAKLADFGCARAVGSGRPLGGTPSFMAPEVARGEEEQGPAADVWALGCTVVEMATGRAPWSDVDDGVLAAVHRIGYTDATPEVPDWLSLEAKDFLARCFVRNPRDRCTAAQLLDHPFLASAACGVKAEEVSAKWTSPKSTLDAALWESDADADEQDGDMSESSSQRIKALAGPCSALPDWDSEEGWIEVLDEKCEACNSVPPTGEDAEEMPVEDECVVASKMVEAETESSDVDADHGGPSSCPVAVGLVARSVEQQPQERRPLSDPPVSSVDSTTGHSSRIEMSKKSSLRQSCLVLLISPVLLPCDSISSVFHIGHTKCRTPELPRRDYCRNIVLHTLESVSDPRVILEWLGVKIAREHRIWNSPGNCVLPFSCWHFSPGSQARQDCSASIKQ